jgi:proteic killer suppression protein
MIWAVAVRKLQLIDYAAHLNDLAFPPGNRLEALTRDRQGEHSIRINEQYRLCFVWTGDGARDVEITDYHQSATALDYGERRVGSSMLLRWRHH